MSDSGLEQAMVRVETELKGLIERIDRMAEDNNKWLHEHELRIRDLENQQHMLVGKLVALMVMAMSGVGVIVAWLSSVWRG